jgi:hypothetical protein
MSKYLNKQYSILFQPRERKPTKKKNRKKKKQGK